MKRNQRIAGTVVITLIIIAGLLYLLFRSTLQENALNFLVGTLLILAVIGLVFIGTRLFNMLLSTLEDISDQRVETTRAKPQPAPSPAPRDIAVDHPKELIKSAKEIVRAYQKGERDFQNVYPSAAAPYETYFKWTTLDGADFSRAILFQAPFDGTSLIGVNFNGASLGGASFQSAILRQADLSWADLSGANLAGADLSGSNLSYATLNGADFSGTTLVGTIVAEEQLEKVKSLKGATLPDGTQAT